MAERNLTLRRVIMFTVVISLLIPALLINGASWFKRYHEDVRDGTRQLLRQNAEAATRIIQAPLWSTHPAQGRALLETMLRQNQDIVRVEVRNNSLGILISRDRPERRTGFTASTTLPVFHGTDTIGSLEIEVSGARLQTAMTADMLEHLLVLAVQLGLSAILILVLLEKYLTRPLRQLSIGAGRLAGHQLDMPFTCNRHDGTGTLSRRLDDTRISLRQLVDELFRKNQRVESDIDQHKRIEQALYERDARYRALVEQSPVAIIEWDIGNHVIEWNTAAEQIFGYSREQALGQHVSFIVPKALHESADIIFGNSAASSGNHGVNKNVRADGLIITCKWRNTPIVGKSGTADCLLSTAEDITEKQRANEALSLSDATFAGAFLCNPDAVSIIRVSDGMILDVNQAFEAITGFAHSEAVGKTSVQLDLWVNRDERIALYERLHVYRMVRDFPCVMRTKQGDARMCQVNGTIFNIGSELYVLTVARDVTDQRRIEEQKAEADRALLRLAQGTQDMVGESFLELLVADLASALRVDRVLIGLRTSDASDYVRTLAVNAKNQSADNFGYFMIGSPSESILAGEINVFPTGIRSQFPHDSALVEEGWDSYAGAPIRDAAGQVIGLLAVMHGQPLANPDLVKSLLQVFSERASAALERKRAEQALRNSEQRFSTIFHSSPVAMSVVRLAGTKVLIDVNNAFERLFLLDRDSTIGKTDRELSLYVNEAERWAVNQAINLKGYIDRYEAWINRGDGSKALFMLSGNTFELAGDKFIIFTSEDITEKHEIENEILELNATLEERVIERTEELQQANQELESALNTLNMAQEELVRSEKLAALGSLVAGIAHELNTPIGNSLIVASTLIDHTRVLADSFHSGLKRSLLENYIKDASKAGEILARNLYRAADLVASFKQVAVDQTSSQRRKFSLSEVVSEIILTLSPTIKKTSFLVNHVIPEELVLDSYPGPLGQVLTNLVNNALLHGLEGRDTGIISIDAQCNAEGWLELTIQDDGVGIPPANLNRIFDPFFTTKLGAGGSGLGLNITHNIVTGMLGGRIRLQSEIDIGTTFIITLPLIAPQLQGDDESSEYSSAIKSFSE